MNTLISFGKLILYLYGSGGLISAPATGVAIREYSFVCMCLHAHVYSVTYLAVTATVTTASVFIYLFFQ
jgi:hypothetical protein